MNENFVELYRDGITNEQEHDKSLLTIITTARQESTIKEWINEIVMGMNMEASLFFFTRVTRLFYESISEWAGIDLANHEILIVNDENPLNEIINKKREKSFIIIINNWKRKENTLEKVISMIVNEMVRHDLNDGGKKITRDDLSMENVERAIRESSDYTVSYISRITWDTNEGSE